MISMLAGALAGALLLKTGLWLSLSVALAAVVVTTGGYRQAVGSGRQPGAAEGALNLTVAPGPAIAR